MCLCEMEIIIRRNRQVLVGVVLIKNLAQVVELRLAFKSSQGRLFLGFIAIDILAN